MHTGVLKEATIEIARILLMFFIVKVNTRKEEKTLKGYRETLKLINKVTELTKTRDLNSALPSMTEAEDIETMEHASIMINFPEVVTSNKIQKVCLQRRVKAST